MGSNKTVYLFHNIKIMTRKESFWFVLGSAFGLYCGTSIYDLSFTNISIGSFLTLVGWALVYGLVYKDIGKRKKNGIKS
jgi:hypothetical protein